jgi:ribonuclease E
MKKEMLINCLQPEEIRIAIIEDGVLEELYVERASHESYVGNIYKGRVVNIEPSIQAAFVDFGVGRNGFLHVSDVEPAYYRDVEERPRGRRDRGDRGDRGDRDRGDRGDRGGRARPQRQFDDYDAPPPPRREYTAPPQEETRTFGQDLEPAAPFADPKHREPPVHDEHGPDIIVEEIYEEDDFVTSPEQASPDSAESSTPEWTEPTDVSVEELEDLPADDIEDTPTVVLDEASSGPSLYEPMAEEPVEESTESEAATEEAEEEEKTKRKPSRRGKGKAAPRGRKPRKKAEPEATDDKPANEPPAASDEPKPRPMDSSECRTGPDDEPLRIDPKPSSELLDEELSFSMAPAPATKSTPVSAPTSSYTPVPQAPPPSHLAPIEEAPDEDIIVQEEEFEEPEMAPEQEDLSSEPLEPAIAKIEPVESLEDLVEEEKALEEEDDVSETEIVVEPQPALEPDDEFGEVEEYMPRDRGRRGGGGGRGGDRGGRGGDRGGRGGDRGGRGGGRDRPRSGGRDSGRRMGGRPGMGRPKPNIEDIFKRGQEVLVQVIKEGIGTKGPTLSTYISIAGRYLVLMPGLNRIGVSRKIEDDDIRRRLREIMNELKPPHGIGFIIRTAGQDRNKNELQSDLAYLSRLWQVVVRRIKKQKSPTEIYRESDMVTRTIRDIFTEDIDTIWVDERGAYEAAKEFMEAVMPRYADRIKYYEGTVPMFHKYGIENEIARIQERKISLPYGGSIVIDQTEALVAIDVNSGNFRADNNNAEETAYQMNLQAAKEIARQLRLRDLGGVIVNDFIDMREERHRRGVEKALRDAVRRDRARTKILRISQFGIIEMTRQRIRPSLKRSAFQECTHCKGTGNVKTGESVSIEVMRMLQLAVNREHIQSIDIKVHDDVAKYLLNKKRKEIVGLEERGQKQVSILGIGAAVSLEHLEFLCLDKNGNEVKFAVTEEAPQRPPRRRGH